MQQRLAQIALIYLGRAKLEGAEVPTYVEVFNWLTMLAQPPAPEEKQDAPVQE